MKNKKQTINWNILLHDIRSVQNVASIFRMAEILGVNKIYLSGITPGPLDRFNREREDFIKISLGTEKVVSWERLGNEEVVAATDGISVPLASTLEKFILDFKNNNGVVIALEQNENSIDYKNLIIDASKKYLIIPGREVEGLEEDVLKLCDAAAEIPQYGQKESLNIFSSMSVACFRFFDK